MTEFESKLLAEIKTLNESVKLMETAVVEHAKTLANVLESLQGLVPYQRFDELSKRVVRLEVVGGKR